MKKYYSLLLLTTFLLISCRNEQLRENFVSVNPIETKIAPLPTTENIRFSNLDLQVKKLKKENIKLRDKKRLRERKEKVFQDSLLAEWKSAIDSLLTLNPCDSVKKYLSIYTDLQTLTNKEGVDRIDKYEFDTTAKFPLGIFFTKSKNIDTLGNDVLGTYNRNLNLIIIYSVGDTNSYKSFLSKGLVLSHELVHVWQRYDSTTSDEKHKATKWLEGELIYSYFPPIKDSLNHIADRYLEKPDSNSRELVMNASNTIANIFGIKNDETLNFMAMEQFELVLTNKNEEKEAYLEKRLREQEIIIQALRAEMLRLEAQIEELKKMKNELEKQ